MKPWYQSKTLWFNALGASVAVLQSLSGTNVIPPSYGVPILLAGNALLRFLTSTSIQGVSSETPVNPSAM